VSFADLPLIRGAPAATAAQMAEVDRVSTTELGITVEMLMENASRQVAATARELLDGVAGKHVVALVGSGNNGGDAAGALRHLANWGATVHALAAAPQEKLRPTTRAQLGRLLLSTADWRVGRVTEATAGAEKTGTALRAADLVIDGLLGYSARGAPRGEVLRLVEASAQADRPVLAVDIPSGIDPDSGVAPGAAVRAAATVTLALPKAGLLTAAAREYVGELILADIGIPAAAFDRVGLDARGVFRDGDLVRVGRQ
jgi:NAD(P)H-hydrate epimerase